MTTGPAVRVLGPVALQTADGGSAPPPGALPTRLVLALVLAGRSGRSIAGLTDDVWQDEPPRNPRAALQMLASRVRAVAEPGLVESTPAGYRILDSDLARAERAGEEEAAAALADWRGAPGADLPPSDLLSELTERAGRARRRLLALEAARLAREHRHPEAVPLLEELVAADLLDGAATRALMTALQEAGAADRALGVFARHREALADALGADPADETAALNTRLLQQAARPTTESTGVRAAATPLLGRDEDVAALLAAVRGARLVSIVGTGGLGKTRLAHAAAAALSGRYDRIVFTELAGARAGEDVALVVGAAVGARAAQTTRRLGDPPVPDLATRTREVLSAGRSLLVLDNCEHVVDAAAALTAELLAAVPALTVLTTSRIPLLLAGEHVVALQPLPADGAGSDLFVQRATAVRPGVALDAATVERVCARLDGLPLAIELAAARLRSMSLGELDRRLTDRFAVLVGGDRTAPERHRTLLAVIDWSRRLLSPAARDALGSLAVPPDGLTAAIAADLLDTDPQEVLTELVDQSLLTFRDDHGADGRYRMLETVREFGLRDLTETGRLADARRGFDRWALRFCRRVGPGLLLGRDTAVLREVAAEEETLLAALRADPAGREAVVVAVFGVLAEHWAYRGDFEAALDALPLLLTAARRRPASADERYEAIRALGLASAIVTVNRNPATTRVAALLRRALRAGAPGPGFWEVVAPELLLSGSFTEIGAGVGRLMANDDPVVRAFALGIQAQLLENRGELDESLALLQQVDLLAARHGLHWLRVFGRMNAVSLRGQRGQHRAALAEAIAIRDDLVVAESGMNLQQLDWMIATAEVAVGRLDAAEQRFERMRAEVERASVPDAVDMRAIACAGLAEVATARGDRPAALAAWDRAIVAARRTTWPWRVLVLADSLAARAGLGVRPADLGGDARRLRGLLLALLRIDPLQADAPVFGAGVLGLAAVLREGRPALAQELAGLAVAMGARRDLVSLSRAAAGAAPARLTPGEAMQRAIELLGSSPALRGSGDPVTAAPDRIP